MPPCTPCCDSLLPPTTLFFGPVPRAEGWKEPVRISARAGSAEGGLQRTSIGELVEGWGFALCHDPVSRFKLNESLGFRYSSGCRTSWWMLMCNAGGQPLTYHPSTSLAVDSLRRLSQTAA